MQTDCLTDHKGANNARRFVHKLCLKRRRNSSGSFFPIACNSRREISSGSRAIRGVGDMFTENRISQDLIRFHRTVVPCAEFASQKLHVGINDSAFRSVFPIFFPLRDELDYRSCQAAPFVPVLYFILFLWLKFLFVASDSFIEHFRKYENKLILFNFSLFIIYNFIFLFRKRIIKFPPEYILLLFSFLILFSFLFPLCARSPQITFTRKS